MLARRRHPNLASVLPALQRPGKIGALIVKLGQRLGELLCRPLEYADRDVMSLVLRGSFVCGVGIFERRLC